MLYSDILDHQNLMKGPKEKFVDQARSNIRDISISLALGDVNISIDLPKFPFLPRTKRTIRGFLTEKEGILSGSKALSLYRINGEKLLSRKARDFDILMDSKNFDTVYSETKYNHHTHPSQTIVCGIFTHKEMYTDRPRYLFRTNIDVILEPNFNEVSYSIVDGFKIADLSYIINQKIELISKIDYQNYCFNKHTIDLINIFKKFNII